MVSDLDALFLARLECHVSHVKILVENGFDLRSRLRRLGEVCKIVIPRKNMETMKKQMNNFE